MRMPVIRSAVQRQPNLTSAHHTLWFGRGTTRNHNQTSEVSIIVTMSIDRNSSLGDGDDSISNSNSDQREEGDNTGFNRFRNQPRVSPRRPGSNLGAGSPTNYGGNGGDGAIGSHDARDSPGDATSLVQRNSATVARPYAEKEDDQRGSRWSGGEEDVQGVGHLPAKPREVVEGCYDGVDSDDGDIDGKVQEDDYHRNEHPRVEYVQGWSPPTPAIMRHGDAEGEEEEGGGGEEKREDEAKKGRTTDAANGSGVDHGSSINDGGTQSRHFRRQPEDDEQRDQGPRPVDMANANDRPVFSGSSSVGEVRKLAGDSDIYNGRTHEPPVQLSQDNTSPVHVTQQRQKPPLQSPLLSGSRSLPPAALHEQQPHQQQEQEQAQTQTQHQQRNLSSRNENEEEEEEEESRDVTASNSDLFSLFGADSDARGATTPSSSDVSALFGASGGEVSRAGVDSSREPGAVSSPHFDHPGSRRSSAAVSSIYCESDVDDGRDNSTHVGSRSFAASEQRDLDGGLAMMRASNAGDGDDDEDEGEEQGLKRKREDRQAIFQRRVGDGFLTLTKYYLTASNTIRSVEAEQVLLIDRTWYHWRLGCCCLGLNRSSFY